MSLDPNQDRLVNAEGENYSLFSRLKAMGQSKGDPSSPNSLRDRMLHGTFWSTAGAIGNRAVVAVMTIILARILKKDSFGDYGALQNAMTTFTLFAGMSLGIVAGRHTAQLAKPDPDRAGRIIALTLMVSCVSGLLIALSIFLGSRLIALGMYNAPTLRSALHYCAPALFFIAISSVQINVVSGLEEFKTLNFLQFLNSIIACILAIIGASVMGVDGVALSLSVASVITWLIYRVTCNRMFTQKGIRLDFKGAWKERALLWSNALPTFLSNMVVLPVYMIANALLRRNPDWGQPEMAVFTVANQWCNLLLYIPSIIVSPLMPILCQLHAAGDFPRLSTVLKKTIGINLLIITLASMAMIALSSFILALYGKDFSTGNLTLRIMLFVAIVQSVVLLINNFLCSTGEMWTAFAFNSLWAAILLIATWLSVPHHQSRGLAASFALSYATLAILQTAYCLFYFKRRGQRAV